MDSVGQVFGPVADIYHGARPPLSVDAVDWFTDGASGDAVELGAGTGRCTALLVKRGFRVRAVEPDPVMREQLTRNCPEVAVIAGVAEQLPVADASADAVFASEAWHWFDQRLAAGEAARVLRPGGRLGALWGSRDDDVPWVHELHRRIGRHHAEGHRPGTFLLPRSAPFAEPETLVLRWNWSVTVNGLITALGTYSHVLSLPEPQRLATLERARDFVTRHFSVDADEVIEVPIRSLARRTRRM